MSFIVRFSKKRGTKTKKHGDGRGKAKAKDEARSFQRQINMDDLLTDESHVFQRQPEIDNLVTVTLQNLDKQEGKKNILVEEVRNVRKVSSVAGSEDSVTEEVNNQRRVSKPRGNDGNITVEVSNVRRVVNAVGSKEKITVEVTNYRRVSSSDEKEETSTGPRVSPLSSDTKDDAMDNVSASMEEALVEQPVFEFVKPVPPSPPTTDIGFFRRSVKIKDDGSLIMTDDGEDGDSICSTSTMSIRANMIDELESIYDRQRDSVIGETGFVFTPLHIVKKLAETLKQAIHIEHNILQHPLSIKRLYRVDILLGPMRGVGQCTRRQLARQLAAVDIIEKLVTEKHEYKLAVNTALGPYGLIPGWRVDDMIYTVMRAVCKDHSVPRPQFSVELGEHHPGTCIATCRVGNKETRGENVFPWLAKKLAAKAMVEKLTSQEYPNEATLYGTDVLGFPEMRLLGYQPKVSAQKRKWLLTNRVKDTQIVVPADEPNDGDMEELEEEVQLEHSKRLKLGELKENIIVHITCNSPPLEN